MAKFTPEIAFAVGNKLGVDWDDVDLKQLVKGMNVELEHGTKHPETDVTGDDPIKTGKIALAHINEIPDYYDRLEKMEKKAKNGTSD